MTTIGIVDHDVVDLGQVAELAQVDADDRQLGVRGDDAGSPAVAQIPAIPGVTPPKAEVAAKPDAVAAQPVAPAREKPAVEKPAVEKPTAPSRTETFVPPPPARVEPAAPPAASPAIREARKSRPAEAKKPAAREDALFEAAAAVLAQTEQTHPANELTAFQSRTLAEGATLTTRGVPSDFPCSSWPIGMNSRDCSVVKATTANADQATSAASPSSPPSRNTVPRWASNASTSAGKAAGQPGSVSPCASNSHSAL